MASTSGSVGGEWPCVGRQSELDRLSRLVEAGRGGLVLAGQAGVGKTRLGLELLRSASTRGVPTLRIAASQSSVMLPFGAFATLLPRSEPGNDRLDMLRRITAAIVGDGDFVVLFVDDAHLLDPASAALTHHLAVDERVYVLATVRTGHPAPDAVVALWKDELAQRIDVEPLRADQVDDLLSIVLGGAVERRSSRLLHERSAGNVLFLRELVLAAVNAGALREGAGGWRLVKELPPSDRLVELVELRLAGLSGSDRGALELLALGEPLGVDLFARSAGGAAIDTLVTRGLVNVETAGRRRELRLAHPLYGDVVRAKLPPARARSMYESLADALEATDARRRDDALRLATWRIEGGGRIDAKVIVGGARRALALHELALARRLAEAALDAGGGFDAGLVLGEVLTLAGQAEQAEDCLAGLEREALHDAQRARLAIARIDNLCYSLGRLDRAIGVAEAAEAAIADQECRDELTAYRVSLLDTSGDTRQALAVAAPFLDRGSGLAFIWATVMASWGLAKTGSYARAVEMADRGVPTHHAVRTFHTAWGPMAQTAVKSVSLAMGGRLAEAESLAQSEYQTGILKGSAETEFVMGWILGMIYVSQGRVVTAARQAREAVALARDHGRLVQGQLALVVLVEALALAGRVVEAGAALAELDACAVPFVHITNAEATRVRARVALAGGDPITAADLLQEAAAIARRSGDRTWEAAALHDLVRFGQPARATTRLTELAEVVEGPLVQAQAAHAKAAVAGDGESLLAASNAFEDLGAALRAAEVAADAAVAWRRAGEPRRANAAARLASHRAGRCEGARTLALVTTAQARAVLRPRELEIARLAAAGHADKEIARRLCISHRTVENRLYSAYSKLGIRGRDELADAIRESGAEGPAVAADLQMEW